MEYAGHNFRIIVADARKKLSRLTNIQFQCCVTSPPYWGLRDYGIENQIGAEVDVKDYIRHLVLVFRKVKKVLSDDGTLWLNIGDSYTSGNRRWRQADKKNAARGMDYRPPTPKGLKQKDLIGIPWRVAFALQKDGWYLRSDIIWQKPNCQPESVKDRPCRSHEYLFLFSKSKKYYYDYGAIKEPAMNGNTKNKRTVWAINTEPFKGAHFAVFPPSLVEPCVLAGSNEGDNILDPFAGSGTVGVVCAKYNRHFTGLELKPEYAKMAYKRINATIEDDE